MLNLCSGLMSTTGVISYIPPRQLLFNYRMAFPRQAHLLANRLQPYLCRFIYQVSRLKVKQKKNSPNFWVQATPSNAATQKQPKLGMQCHSNLPPFPRTIIEALVTIAINSPFNKNGPGTLKPHCTELE